MEKSVSYKEKIIIGELKLNVLGSYYEDVNHGVTENQTNFQCTLSVENANHSDNDILVTDLTYEDVNELERLVNNLRAVSLPEPVNPPF